MAQETDHTKFNMNSLLSFRNKEKDKVLSIGAYNGQMQFTMGSAKFDGKPRNVFISLHMAGVLKSNINEILQRPEPGKKFTMIYNGLYNAETKRRELSFTCTIGVSDAAICYIGIRHVDKDRTQWTGLFDLRGDPYLEIAGFYDDEKTRSRETLRLIYDLLDKGYFHTGALLTRNYMVTSFDKSGSNKTSSSDIVEY